MDIGESEDSLELQVNERGWLSDGKEWWAGTGLNRQLLLATPCNCWCFKLDLPFIRYASARRTGIAPAARRSRPSAPPASNGPEWRKGRMTSQTNRRGRVSPLYSRSRLRRPTRPLTLTLSPSGGEGIELTPSPSSIKRAGVRVGACSRIIRVRTPSVGGSGRGPSWVARSVKGRASGAPPADDRRPRSTTGRRDRPGRGGSPQSIAPCSGRRQ